MLLKKPFENVHEYDFQRSRFDESPRLTVLEISCTVPASLSPATTKITWARDALHGQVAPCVETMWLNRMVLAQSLLARDDALCTARPLSQVSRPCRRLALKVVQKGEGHSAADRTRAKRVSVEMLRPPRRAQHDRHGREGPSASSPRHVRAGPFDPPRHKRLPEYWFFSARAGSPAGLTSSAAQA